MTLNPFLDLFGVILAFFYGIVPEQLPGYAYGFAIIALTLLVMVIVTPLTLKGTRSMMMMQQLQPEMKKLQSKYKDDRQKLNEELLKFYKENNINPVGGCLPLLIQMPVFIVLYNTFRGLTLRIPTMGFNVGWVTGQQGISAPISKPPVALTNFQPDHLPTDSSMYNAMVNTNTMAFAGMDLATSCSTALSQGGIVTALPYMFLIAVVAVTGFVQQRQIQGRNPQANVNPQQQQIMKIMPIFLPVISFGLPSGLVLYFAVSNLYRIGQQWFISRSIYGIKKGETGSGSGSGTASRNKIAPSSEDGGGSSFRKSLAALTAGRGAEQQDAPTAKASSSSKSSTSTKAQPTKSRSAGATKAAPSGGVSVKAAKNGSGGAPAKNGSDGSKAKATNRTDDANGSGRAGKPSATKKAPPASPSSSAAAPPTLQPRARKNKKR